MTRRRLKFTDWPAQDRSAWEVLLQPGSLLRRGGAFAHLRPRTLSMRKQSYGHWLAFCRQQGLDLEAMDPAGRATDDLIVAWAEEMSDLAWTTRRIRLTGLLSVLRGLAPDRSLDVPIRNSSKISPGRPGQASCLACVPSARA